jgi:hypothetical protein
MVYDVGTTMALEAWDTRYKPNQDWNHAWGAAPANLIPRWLVGVWPTSSGAETLRIAPQPADLGSFTAKVPTVRGAVDVRFRQSGTSADMVVTLPGNTVGFVELPIPQGTQLIGVKQGNRPMRSSASYRITGGVETKFSWSWRAV